MGEIWRMTSHMESVIKAYKTLSRIPSIVGGRLNSKGKRVTSKWSIRNLDKGKNTQYLIDYVLDEKLSVISESDFAVDVSQELLTAVSPKESFKAVIREEKEDKDGSKKKFFLEVWSKNLLKNSIDLTSLDIHGDVYADSEFGSLDWSPDEKKIVYVAEKKLKKSEPFIKRKPVDDKNKDSDKKPIPGEEHLYREDWGEQLTGKYQSVVVVCKLTDESFTILENIPDNWCPGQVRFTPDGEGVVGVAWDISAVRRLGLIYCTNRPSYIFWHTLDGKLRKLSEENKSVRSPRFSPLGDLFWLQREVGGPHHACHQLARITADDICNVLKSDPEEINDKVSIVIDIVKTEKEICNKELFYGIYCQNLPVKCFSSDGRRLIFSTQQQNEIRSYVVDTDSGNIVDISNKNIPGSTTVLSVQSDVVLAAWSNMSTPGQLYVAKLPESGKEYKIEWNGISTPCSVPNTVANAKIQYMSLKHEDSEDDVSSFTAIYFGPNENGVYPLVVWPHGGPHSAFSNSYSLEAAFFNMLGFACLLINYRGSTGAGDASVFFLPSRIGTSDVADCKLATEKSLDLFPINDKKLLLYGGSHGGFLVTHLSVYSELYSATVARNPVIDLASMYNTTDIADCYRALFNLLSAGGTNSYPHSYSSTPGVTCDHRLSVITYHQANNNIAKRSLGFSTVRINYRGSTGNGDSNVKCLLGNIGDYEIKDCYLTLTTLKERDRIHSCLLYGGSYGGFIAGHLAGRYPRMFSAVVLRNPLIDLASKAHYADNPDGCTVEIGMPFKEDEPEIDDKLLALRRVSPLVNAHKVTVPTALMLGSKDKRVPYYQGLEYSRKLKANGVTTKVFMYEDNHALSSLPVEMDNLINAADWFITAINP